MTTRDIFFGCLYCFGFDPNTKLAAYFRCNEMWTGQPEGAD